MDRQDPMGDRRSDDAAPRSRIDPRTAGWCRRCWDNPWVKLVAIFSGFVTTVMLIIVWSGCIAPNSWDRWLDRLNSSGFNMSNPNARFGYRPKPVELAYFGDGRAELGKFSVRMFDPLTRTTMRTDFKLEGKTTFEDETSFQDFMRHNNRFFREQVDVTLRSCHPEELAQADADLLQRKLVSRVNRALGRKMIESVEMKDFAVFESVDKSSFVRLEPKKDDSSELELLQ